MTEPTFCSDLSSTQLDLLKEIARMQMGHGLDYDSKIMDQARKKAEKRFEESQMEKRRAQEQLEEHEAGQMQKAVDDMLDGASLEELLRSLGDDHERARLSSEIDLLNQEPQQLIKDDFEKVISRFNEKGLTDATKPKVTLTSKGARLLGHGYLSRILQKLSRQGVGPHTIEDVGHGPWQTSTIRPYQAGDPYERISFEHSILATLERGSTPRELELRDFRVYEAIHSTEVQFGILVDQSASMARGGKMEAAVETALALAELMRSEFPEDKLHIYAFSEEVQKVRPWELPSTPVQPGYTDIRAALRQYRREVAFMSGNKQAHLITDSAPNFEDGEYTGFIRASRGLVEEAKRFKAAGIVLNIVMLDEERKFRDVAKEIAQQNLGRVFFMRPGELGEAVVEDYLLSKKETIRF